uniref:Vacuolar protein sorting-associated protein 8 central domain-containing protein n=1 Tax=Pseudo-nitzschia delicatissima TaxID=44447 RepID=A0A7S0UJY0_9STRA|mmetsp:Transcript_2744/g.5753  ORF Transcript_2744/g.5753 Transcript_2744/m.5753 type:complete len:838 (+) Transcript_2744:1-2514(+)
MYSALFYIYNQGLKDFTTPMEILCESIFDAADTLGQLTNDRRIDGVPQNDFERFGYKAILYLQSTFSGQNFPKDTKMAEDIVHKVRPQLLKLLLKSRYKPSRSIRAPAQVIGQRALRYPYAHILLMVDPKAMFDTLSTAMDAPDEEFSTNGSSGVQSIGGWEVEVSAESGSNKSSGNSSSTRLAPDRQEIISMLLSIMMPSKDDVTITHQTTLYKSESAVNAFLDFLAEYLMRGVIRTSKLVTFMILNRMATRYSTARDSEDRKKWQGQIIALLSALPRSSYESNDVLALVEKSGIHRASLLLHQEEASAWSHKDMTMERRATHFCAAVDCYLDDDDADFRKEVFSYVKKECSGATDEKEPNALRDALITKLVDLVILDPLLTAELTADLFVDDPDLVIRSLQDEEARFMFLKAVISGDLNDMDAVAGSVLNAQLTTEHHHEYMALMAKLYPDMVYDYLSTHNNYRTEECLQLCQNYDIADASAYLLERMGNVTSALQLILQTMETRMMNLKRTIRGMSTDYFDKYYSKHRHITKRTRIHPELSSKQQKEIDGLKKILTVALDVCERNSGSFSSRTVTEHGSQLWFNVLDRLINAKGFLRLSKEQPGHAKIMSGVLSELLRMTMQRMVSSVPLPDLVRKVTSDHSGSRLGEVREMIESLLATYGQELGVFGSAVSVFHYDSHQMEKTHHGLRVCGSNVQSVMGVGLNKSSNSVKTMKRIRNDHEILQLGGFSGSTRGDASVVIADAPRRPGSKAERGLGDALSRLRSRRQRGPNGNTDTNGLNIHNMRKASGLNLMTSNEMSYRRGELSDDVTFFEDRQVGQLGAAEHRGRIMSFIY